LIQPTIVGLVEITLWLAFFSSTGQVELMGFGKEHYLAYAFWAAFVSRISTSWMYETQMIEDIETGNINSVLVRPISFFEYYLGQLMGYKALTTAISMIIPIGICLAISLPVDLFRLPLALTLVFYYLILVHILSMTIASLGFFFTRIHHLTVAKNITLWMFTGEFFPLDLAPEPFRSALVALPFSSAVYRPVGYLTERLDVTTIFEGFVSVTIGILVLAPISAFLWLTGRRKYSGTGA
jgi:ABC-2 type transport system permease protein